MYAIGWAFLAFDILAVTYLWLTREPGYGDQVPSVPLQSYDDAMQCDLCLPGKHPEPLCPETTTHNPSLPRRFGW